MYERRADSNTISALAASGLLFSAIWWMIRAVG